LGHGKLAGNFLGRRVTKNTPTRGKHKAETLPKGSPLGTTCKKRRTSRHMSLTISLYAKGKGNLQGGD